MSKQYEFIKAEQRSEAWHALRAKGITATDATVIAGLSPYKTPFQLWAEKLGKAEPAPVGEAAQRGIILEDAVARFYEESTGRKLKKSNGIVRVRVIPWAMASLDRTVVGEPGLVEIKTSASRRWSLYPVPPEVEAQVQWQMFVTGAPWVDVVALLGSLVFRVERVAANIDLQTDLYKRAIAFREALATETPPTMQVADAGTFAALVPQGTDEFAHADDEAERVARTYEELRAEAKALDEQAEAAALILKEKIGAKAGLLGSTWTATWKQNKPSLKTDWKEVAEIAKSVAPETYEAALKKHSEEKPGARVFKFKMEGVGE
jgi:putative phage-type endonuclease